MGRLGEGATGRLGEGAMRRRALSLGHRAWRRITYSGIEGLGNRQKYRGQNEMKKRGQRSEVRGQMSDVRWQ